MVEDPGKILGTHKITSFNGACKTKKRQYLNNVNTIVRHEERKTTRKCGLWKWGRCTQYVSEIKINFKCKEGWAQESSASKGCDYAICAGKTNLSGACNIRYYDDYQKTRKETFYNSGGKCSSPDICSGCNNGFYSDGPYCRICGRIDHCNFRKCTTSNNQHCEICEGDIKPNKYWSAYTNHLDNTKCQKACSWRTDSTRCYPGTCTNELFSGCVCADNFSGTHCENSEYIIK
ncbi:Hypothetical predicted protein [Mytilus galloprovincialis]|uniref:EGF-like domain-containing protein n=1 Tax=Mytilus galloprovincialis TaxID=29158 RepID=A0A8B6FQI8_MYTGA|nr:Hypothetical predicted protein [Mytilus galloprovincialis]